MNNKYSDGTRIIYTNNGPSAVAGGSLVIIGELAAVTSCDCPPDGSVSAETCGVFALPKAAGAVTAGQALYLDGGLLNTNGSGALAGAAWDGVVADAISVLLGLNMVKGPTPEPDTKSKTLFAFGDSITEMGTNNVATIDIAASSADGEYLTIDCGTRGHGLQVNDYVRLNNLNPELCKVYRVAEVVSSSIYKVPSAFTGTLVKPYSGVINSQRVESARTGGYIQQAMWLSGSKFKYLGTTAIWGNEAVDMVTRLAADGLDFVPKPDVIHFLGGTNDITQGKTNEQLMGYYEQIRLACASAGIKLIFGTLPARDVTAPAGLAGATQTRDLRPLVLAWCAENDIPCADYFTATVGSDGIYGDPEKMAAGAIVTLHYSPYGNMCMANALVPLLGQVFDGESTLPETLEDCGVALNPFFMDTQAASGTGQSGIRPANCSIFVSSTGGAEVVSDVFDDPEGYGKIWRLHSEVMPSGYGFIARANASSPDEVMAYDGYVVFEAKIKYTPISGNPIMQIRNLLAREGVSSTYSSDPVTNLYDKEPFTFEWKAAPVFFKAGEAISLPASCLAVTLLNGGDEGSNAVGEVEISRVAIRFYEGAMPYVR